MYNFLFTFININSWNDLVILLGYFLCFFIYYFLSKSNFIIHYNLRDSLFYLSIFFVVINSYFISDSSAYSFVKNQFTGFFNNANSFTGLCGLFFVLNFSIFSTVEEKSKRYVSIILMGVLSIYLLLGASRGAILSTAVASFFLLVTSRKKKTLVFSFLLLVVFLVVFRDSLFYDTPDRDVFEDSGRKAIFLNYWNELKERYFYIGTGVSLGAGRIKTELSYLDVLLMSGFIGFIGFVSFIIRTLYLSFFLIKKDSVWLTAVYIYIVTASVFEGYAANIMHLNSILFYIIPALIYSSFREIKEDK